MLLYSRDFSYEKESYDRNYILTSLHNNIPSYALWEDFYIKQQNLRQRFNWWKSLNIPEVKSEEKKIRMEWINYFNGFSKNYKNNI